MNTCTVCNSRPKFPVISPQKTSNEKLAFVERVCGILIESRFRAGVAAPWNLDICASGSRTSTKRETCTHYFCASPEGLILNPVRFARPPLKGDAKRAKAYFTTGIRRSAQSLLDRVPHGIIRDPKLFATRSLLARGSPCLVREKYCDHPSQAYAN